MSILVDSSTRVLVQGITGRAGTFYTDAAMRYGTQMVAGVRPGKGGTKHLTLPIYDTVQEAKTATQATASMIVVPAHNAAEAIMEAITAEIAIIVCVTERVPVLDMVRVKDALSHSKSTLIGANSHGILTPGQCKIGVMSTNDASPGCIGILSRSASLTSEIVAQTTKAGLGQTTTIGIGGDPVHGMGFCHALQLFKSDPDTKGVILIGEIGGSEEEQAAAYLSETTYGKPVVALIVGHHAPRDKRMGHAGTLAMFGARDIKEKERLLQDSGIHIAHNAEHVSSLMHDALR